MLNVRLTDDHLYGKLLFTWLSLVCLWWCLFVLSLFPRDVLGEILDLIESVSKGFPTYFWWPWLYFKLTGIFILRARKYLYFEPFDKFYQTWEDISVWQDNDGPWSLFQGHMRIYLNVKILLKAVDRFLPNMDRNIQLRQNKIWWGAVDLHIILGY